MADPITKSIIVKAKPEDAFNVWADFENFPKFMANVKSVTKVTDQLSHWVTEGPLGKTIEWDAETTTFEPPTRIGWNSRDRNSFKTSGQVLFTELPHGEVEVTVTLKYDPPGGAIGQAGSALFDDVEERLDQDLRRFKKFVEAPLRSGSTRAAGS